MGKDNGFIIGLVLGVVGMLFFALVFALGLEVGKSTAIETRPPVVIRDTIPEPQNDTTVIVITRAIEVR